MTQVPEGRPSYDASLSTSLRSCTRSRRAAGKLDDPHRPVAGHKRLVRDSPNVRLGDFFDPVDRTKQLPPVVIARLIEAKREGQTLIRSERADQVRLSPSLDHLQLFIR